MIRKISIPVILFCFLPTIYAQLSETSQHSINWQTIDKWYIDSTSVSVLSFVGAQYPGDNHLPYFNKRISYDNAFQYKVEIKNEVFISLSPEESDLIAENNISNQHAEVHTDILKERGTSYFNVSILPFVNKEGKIQKIASFDLLINKTPQQQKIASTTRHTYAASSVLAQGKFVKIRIINSGVYKLTYEDLNAMGISPANVRVYGYGGNVLEQSFLLPKIDDLPELAIWMEKGADGVFNAGDYILFYAQGINKWTFDKTKQLFTHQINTYSNYGYYFVTSDVGVGRRIVDKIVDVSPTATIKPIDEFTDYHIYEKELTNLSESGKEFFGDKFGEILSLDIPFEFPNAVVSKAAVVRLDVAANTGANTSFKLSLNGTQDKILNLPARTGNIYENARAAFATYTFNPISSNYLFNLTFNKSGSANSLAYLNYLEVNARRQLKMNGIVMQFQNIDFIGLNGYGEYSLNNATSNTQIWDITAPSNISKIPSKFINGKLTFTDSNTDVKSYLAIDPTAATSFSKPEILDVVVNQNLHAIQAANMVILTHPNFIKQAEKLANVHREKDNLTVEVVTTEQVYNEFSSGTPDATAYRWFMKMLYDRANANNNQKDIPKYLLLFGKGTYDNRKLLSNSGENLILTYQTENSLEITLSYVTDDYFALLDDIEGGYVPSGLMDISVGRFSVTSQQQATDVVNKTIDYINNDKKGFWKNQLLFLADDGDGSLHAKQADIVAESIQKNSPAFQTNKIYLDAYKQEINASGESYPAAKIRFQNLLQNGLFMLNYTGHGGPSGWTNESILSGNDVKMLANKNLPIWVAPTCDFNLFDVQNISAGEDVVINPLGGGIGIFSAARPVYASQNFVLNKLFTDNLFKKQNGEYPRIGDAIAFAKNNIGTEINKLSYIYLGDPAVRLNYPTNYNVITSKLNENTVFGNDTLKALSVVTIQGIIADNYGNKVDNFNGKLNVVVYDKAQIITSLNNQGDGGLTFSDRQNILFSGDVGVLNGLFSITFMLPKDIKYNYGTGRINYYAQDYSTGTEAQGYFENFIVGGSNSNNIVDTDGPEVNLFLNSANFVSGDKVNETPLFMADISDINGINTVGSGIGHDMMLTIDNDPLQSYIINEYFQSKVNSYTEGSVKYKLPELNNGMHKLTFRALDLVNNSTIKTIDFEVIKGLTPEIFTVYNFPNPVKTQTNFVITHDRPETILNTTVEVFDISGRKIWSKSQLTAENLSWDLIANNGNKVKAGIYFYHVNLKTANSNSFSKSNKMIVVE